MKKILAAIRRNRQVNDDIQSLEQAVPYVQDSWQSDFSGEKFSTNYAQAVESFAAQIGESGDNIPPAKEMVYSLSRPKYSPAEPKKASTAQQEQKSKSVTVMQFPDPVLDKESLPLAKTPEQPLRDLQAALDTQARLRPQQDSI